MSYFLVLLDATNFTQKLQGHEQQLLTYRYRLVFLPAGLRAP